MALSSCGKLESGYNWHYLQEMHILASNFSAKQHKLKVREGVIFFFFFVDLKRTKQNMQVFSFFLYGIYK